jgi:hypothetical protein
MELIITLILMMVGSFIVPVGISFFILKKLKASLPMNIVISTASGVVGFYLMMNYLNSLSWM